MRTAILIPGNDRASAHKIFRRLRLYGVSALGVAFEFWVRFRGAAGGLRACLSPA
jgi:hypothetical protein